MKISLRCKQRNWTRRSVTIEWFPPSLTLLRQPLLDGALRRRAGVANDLTVAHVAERRAQRAAGLDADRAADAGAQRRALGSNMRHRVLVPRKELNIENELETSKRKSMNL